MKRKSDPLAPLWESIQDLLAWLKVAKVPAILIGGVAVSLQSRPRHTEDVDALILLEEKRWVSFSRQGKKYGFVPRIPDMVAFAREARVLLFQHERSKISIDIVLGKIPFELEIVSRALLVKVAGIEIPLATPEDLIVMKALARRARDITDIESLLDAHPKVDLRRCRQWVRVLSENMDNPEINVDFENALQKHKATGKKTKGK